MLPAGDGVPAGEWNFATHAPRDANLNLRDHGNEIVSGLAEWVMVETGAPRSRAEQYRPEVERMMDVLLERNRDAAGLWSDHVIPADSAPPSSPAQPVNDNWGYLAAGYKHANPGL